MVARKTKRERAAEEAREAFLQHLRRMAAYWNGVQDITKLEALDGLAFSMLTAIDGVAALPGYLLAEAGTGTLLNADVNLHDYYYNDEVRGRK